MKVLDLEIEGNDFDNLDEFDGLTFLVSMQTHAKMILVRTAFMH